MPSPDRYRLLEMTPGQDNHEPSHGRRLQVSFDTLAQLLGGARARDVLAATSGAAPFIEALDGSGAWLTPGTDAAAPTSGTARQFAFEVVSLKMRAFAAITKQLTPDHAQIEPADVTAHLLDSHGLLGATRWHVQITVTPRERATEPPTSLRKSLGQLLGRLLFSSDQRGPDAALAHALEIAKTFASGSGSSPTENAQRLFTNGPGSDSLAVLFAQDMRARLGGLSGSGSLWSQIGGMMLRLLTDVADFSLPDPPLEELAPMLAQLRQRLDIATFGAIARRDEISNVLRHNLSRLQGD